MSGVNKVILVGHVGHAPVLRMIDPETPVSSFPLVTTEIIYKHGVETETAEWHQITLWRSMCEAGARILKKGQLIHIEGKLRTRKVTDNENVVRYVTEINAEKFTLLGRPADFADNEVGHLEKST